MPLPSSDSHSPCAPTARFFPRVIPACALLACGLFGAHVDAAEGATDPNTSTRVETALETGDVLIADSLYKSETRWGSDAQARHEREILGARLTAARGDWRGAEARLLAWEQSSARRSGSGEILFWRGWAALHQGRTAEADSLFVLSSAYVEGKDGEYAQEALEYRYATLLENSPVLLNYVRGLPESPLPTALRAASLKQVPPESRLYPHALWRLALLAELQGDTSQSRAILSDLARDASSMPAKRAVAVLAFLREKSSPDTALKSYEALLIKNQQGAIAEFLRQRIQRLR